MVTPAIRQSNKRKNKRSLPFFEKLISFPFHFKWYVEKDIGLNDTKQLFFQPYVKGSLRLKQ
ncbi:hypothetical protein GCM10008968_02050 [Bacillus horti]